jgi:hypothetical protein
MELDQHGYLNPATALLATESQVREMFCFNDHRDRLWENYLEFNRKVLNLVKTNTTVWLDGSFISHKPFPRDIDVVYFLDLNQDTINRVESNSRLFLYLFDTAAKSDFQVEAYWVPIYPPQHPDHQDTVTGRKYWKNLFSKSKETTLRKGFIQINYPF